jgi:hypothetical protein
VTLLEEHRLVGLENGVLRRIVGSKSYELTAEWRRLHSEELCDLYLPNIGGIESRRVGWAGNVARIGDRRGAYRVLVGKLEGKRPLGRPRCGWEDIIKMDLQKVGWGIGTGLIWFSIGTGGGRLLMRL